MQYRVSPLGFSIFKEKNEIRVKNKIQNIFHSKIGFLCIEQKLDRLEDNIIYRFNKRVDFYNFIFVFSETSI